ncbi:glutamate racemase [Candidatus Latescibacterota bacterium]
MMKTIIRHIIIYFIVLSVFYGCSGEQQHSEETPPQSLINVIGKKDSDIFPIAFDRYQSLTSELPIGVFDSGIGGLTVLSEIVRLDNYNNVSHEPGSDGIPDFEVEHFVYLGDQANMPYGNYDSENKTEFLRELVIKDAVFLLGNRYWPSQTAVSPIFDKPPVKAIVIACNTATAFGLEHVRESLIEWNIPIYIIGVVNAGADGAIEALVESGVDGNIAVMATVGTCSSEGYVRAVDKSAQDAAIITPQVTQQGCLGLAGAIERDASYITTITDASENYQGPSIENQIAPIDTSLFALYSFENSGIIRDKVDVNLIRLNSVENYIRYHTTMLVENYRKTGNSKPIGTVILGCTHFPFYADRIEASFKRLRNFSYENGSKPYEHLIPEHISFIDPAQFTAVQLYEELRDSGLLIEKPENSVIGTDEFYISIPHSATDIINLTENGAFTYKFKYGRDEGNIDIEYVKRIPMSKRTLSPTVIQSITETMPWIRERLAEFNAESPRCSGIPESERIPFQL